MSMSQQKISQAKLLQQVREASFALIDLGLFLDTHPRDEKAMDYFNRYQQQKKDLTREYEKNYGPLSYSGINTCQGWTWVQDPWPWEGGCK